MYSRKNVFSFKECTIIINDVISTICYKTLILHLILSLNQPIFIKEYKYVLFGILVQSNEWQNYSNAITDSLKIPVFDNWYYSNSHAIQK